MNLCTKNMVAVNIVLMDKLSYKILEESSRHFC